MGEEIMLKRIIKKIINLNYKIIKNYYNSKFNKKVLISYVTEPFYKGVSQSHSNTAESIEIAKVFHSLGYVVDIYDFRYKKNINFLSYDVIFGIGDLIERALESKNRKTVYIYYATGAYFCFANSAEVNRIKNLYQRKGLLLKPKRFIKNPKYLSTQISDAIIVTGNNWTVATYVNSLMPIYKVPVSVYDILWKKEIKRDIDKARKSFLWFGSSGLIHKGLDLCLEVFKELPEYNLYICGPKEEDFFELYSNELKLENINYLGFMEVSSFEFRRLVELCLFVIYPSCSEGTSGALLTCMSVGLIPVATKETGVHLNNGFSISNNELNIVETIGAISKLDINTLEKLSKDNAKYIECNHTIHDFRSKINKNIIKILGAKNG
jgi:glycosyltransferase involved in cell wall biosynthesis